MSPRSYDATSSWQTRIAEHHANKIPLRIVGGNTKHFYGLGQQQDSIATLTTTEHVGIIAYEPSELVLTARSGTPLQEIEATLAAQRQMLAFEPPHFGSHATLGGCIACGLSGPRRPHTGSARDFVLGVNVINGKAEALRFGGQVMKNVAGYDVARLFCGSLGTLGVILDVSLKVLPVPDVEVTLRFEHSASEALLKMRDFGQKPMPISAMCYFAGHLYLRLSGTERAVQQTQQQLGGESLYATSLFWQKLKEHTLPFFNTDKPVWRIAVPSATPPLAMNGEQLIEWGGAQRWLVSDTDANTIYDYAQRAGGHATLFRHHHRDEVFQPLHGKLKELHINTKLAFDPHGILNRGRMYSFY